MVVEGVTLNHQLIVDPLLSKSRFERDIRPLVSNSIHYEKIGLRLIKNEFPILIVALKWNSQNREIFLHVEADNYDYLPIRGWWVDQNGIALQQGQQIPNGKGFQIQSTPYGENQGWMCFNGWREYHDHQSHQGISWSSIRDEKEYRLPSILLKLLTDLNSSGVETK